jgi:hypothetical protein
MPLNYKSIQKSSTEAQSVEIYECTVTSALVKSMSIYNGSGGSADVIAKIKKSGQSQKVLYQNKSIVADSTIQLLDEVVILENGDEIWIQFSAGSIDSTTMLVESTAVLNATSVKELSDWSTTTPNDGQVPTWNSATGQYEPVDSSATISDTDDLSEGSTNLYYTNARADARIAAASIDDLSDVDTTTATPTTGQALLWDGTQWEPGTVSTVSDLDGLTDVSASSPTNGDVIVYNGAINTWVTSRSLANLVDKVKDPTPDTTVIEKDASNKITIDNTTGSEKISATVDGTKALELTDTEARVLNVVVQDQNEVQFKQVASNGGNYVSLKAPAQLASNVDFVLPNADGASGTFLKTNGSGALSFASITEATGSELENVVEDTTPQLGGNLDVNGNKIVSASNGDIVLEPDGTGNVGIGTTSPSAKLDVSGEIQTTSGGSFGADGTTASIFMNTTANRGLSGRFGAYARNLIKSDGSATIEIGENSSLISLIKLTAGSSSVDGVVSFFTKNAERMRVAPDGNVGIGTASPTFANGSGLEIERAGIATLRLQDTTNVANVELQSGESGLHVRVGANGSSGNLFNVSSAGASRLLIDTSGNVGIGTTTPARKLQVRSTEHNDGIRVGVSGSPLGRPHLELQKSNGFTWSMVAGFNSNLYFKPDLADTEGDDDDAILTLTLAGNVGIGNKTPSEKLEVSGNIQLASKADSILFGGSGSDGTWGAPKITRIGTQIIVSDFSGVQFGGYDGSAYGARMTVLGTGNVGIGTTSPSDKLHVNSGNIRIDGGFNHLIVDHGTNSGSSGVILQGTGSNLPFVRWTDGTNIIAGIRANSSGDLRIQTNGFNDRITINSSGRVGIGATSPAKELEVNGGIRIGANETIESNGGITVVVDVNNNETDRAFTVAQGSTANPLLTVKESGNVGIGTTAPAQKLEVSFAASTYGARFTRNDAAGSSLIEFANNAGVKNVTGYNAGVDGYTIGTSADTHLTVRSTGNVGIGTTSPSQKLDVVGQMNLNDGSNNVMISSGNSGLTGASNTAVGYQSLYNSTTGNDNTATGLQAMYSLTTGTNNTAVGYKASYSNTTGFSNTAVGRSALYNCTGSLNVAIGRDAALGGAGASFSNTVAVGYQALTALTTGAQNTAVGFSSLRDLTTGANNTAVGYQSMLNSTTGDNNTAVGHQASYNLTTGNANISLGNYALYSSQTGEANTAIGYANSYSLTTGVYNVSLGNSALYANQTGGANVAIGYAALNTTTSGNNTAVGHLSAYYAGASNAAFGAYALNYTTGSSNVAIGFQAARGVNGTSSFSNTVAVGREALKALTTGADNTAVGYQSLYNLTTGADNTAVGVVSSYNTTTGNYNVSLGNYALRQNQTGAANTAMGYGALYYTTYSNNTAVGYFAGYFAGSHNAAFGSRALNYTTGNYNVAVGQGAAQGVSGTSTFGNTVAVGYQAGTALTTGGSNVLIGYQAGSTLTTESNKLYIENSNSSNPLIYGEFDNDLVRVNGDFEATGGYGFNGESATAVQTGYTPTNVTTTRSFDADSVTLDSLADVVGTLIEDLKTKGLISA